MSLSRQQAGALALPFAALIWSSSSKAEVTLAETDDWTVSTDGRANGFISHIWGDDRPEGTESLQWVAYNEAGTGGQADSEGKLRRTRIRGGYVPSTLAFNVRKETAGGLKLAGRAEIGMQIANIEPSFAFEPTWMDPRSVYLDVSGDWGGVRVGRDLSLFPRSNLIMNYELGHAYGVGFPCTYERIYGGACGHVGFGTLWPDFRAQVTYRTPKIGDVLEISVGLFDPRTVPTYNWTQTPLPRLEAEAVANYNWDEGWGIKAWGNGAYQQVGTTAEVIDQTTFEVVGLEDYKLTAFGVGGGIQGYLGPFKAGVSGYMGEGMDAYEFLTFNPILVGTASLDGYQREFRPSRGILAEASFTLGNTWIMGGFGKVFLDSIATDSPTTTPDVFPVPRTHTGISAGIFHRIENIVIGLDYFNAQYGFDPHLISLDDGGTQYVTLGQTVNIVNAGMTLEW